MKLSFDGMGQWGATFAGGAAEGEVVALAENGTVAVCGADAAFCGVVLAAGRDGAACSVQLGGVATAAYSGTAPQAGWVKLAGDGDGGVKTAEAGRAYLILSVDEAGKSATFVL